MERMKAFSVGLREATLEELFGDVFSVGMYRKMLKVRAHNYLTDSKGSSLNGAWTRKMTVLA
jgi:hypothetical protein